MRVKLISLNSHGFIFIITFMIFIILGHSKIVSLVIANQLTPKTVTVQINNNLGYPGGSGVIIAKEGNTYMVLTANHVVLREDAEYTILTHSEQNYSVKEVKRLQNQPENIDLAIAIFETSDTLEVAILADSKQAVIGSKIYVSGYPLPSLGMGEKREFTLTSGTITSDISEQNNNRWGYTLQYDANTRKGMSGGPIFDIKNRVLGIHGQGEIDDSVIGYSSGEEIGIKTGFNRGIPINTFWSFQSRFELKQSSLIVDNTPIQENNTTELNNPKTTLDFYLLGLNARQKNDLDQAINYFNKAIQIDANHAQAYFQRGITHSLQGEPEKAIFDYTQTIKKHPDHVNAYYNRGLIRGRDLGDYQRALADFNQVIRLTSEDAGAYANRGNIYFALNQYKKAIQDYTQAIKINSNSGDAYYTRGLAYGKLGHFENAAQDCQKAAQIFRSQDALARYQKAINCLEQIP
jgi:tetratricopeptide (TPR) repeat protein